MYLKKKGFTLVELVVVMCIIGVLATILVPSMIGYIKKSKRSSDIASAKTIYNDAAIVLAEGGDSADAYMSGCTSTCDVSVTRKGADENYTLEIVCKRVAGMNTDWESSNTSLKPFVDSMNKIQDADIPLKFRFPEGKSGGRKELDRWIIAKKQGEVSKIEVWAADSSNTPCYRVWPETDDNYK